MNNEQKTKKKLEFFSFFFLSNKIVVYYFALKNIQNHVLNKCVNKCIKCMQGSQTDCVFECFSLFSGLSFFLLFIQTVMKTTIAQLFFIDQRIHINRL